MIRIGCLAFAVWAIHPWTNPQGYEAVAWPARQAIPALAVMDLDGKARAHRTEKGALRWRQQWVPYAQISDHLKRAVIASEDGDFINHDGVEWEAIEKAWQKNAQAEELAAKRAARTPPGKPAPAAKAPKIVGGSTITQQLAKNLLLSGERTLLRKGQEFVLTMALEAPAVQAAHPGDLPEPRRMGRRRVRRRGGGAALLPQERRASSAPTRPPAWR
jgi:membrane peptidoglycan carboxypeptidase